MPEARLGGRRLACLVILSALALLPGLGSSGRLTYHEAFVAQGAREILHSGEWGYPTIGGLPWLEKPPLPWWLVAVLAHLHRRGDRDGGAASLCAGCNWTRPGSRRAGHAPLWPQDRPACGCGPEHDRLDRDARPTCRGRHPANVLDHLDDRGLRPDSERSGSPGRRSSL